MLYRRALQLKLVDDHSQIGSRSSRIRSEFVSNKYTNMRKRWVISRTLGLLRNERWSRSGSNEYSSMADDSLNRQAQLQSHKLFAQLWFLICVPSCSLLCESKHPFLHDRQTIISSTDADSDQHRWQYAYEDIVYKKCHNECKIQAVHQKTHHDRQNHKYKR